MFGNLPLGRVCGHDPVSSSLVPDCLLTSQTELQVVFTPIISLVLLNTTGAGRGGGCLCHFPGAAETQSSQLTLKLLFPLCASRNEAEECEMCDASVWLCHMHDDRDLGAASLRVGQVRFICRFCVFFF